MKKYLSREVIVPAAIIVFIRYYRVFIIPENDVRFGERKFSTRLNTIKHRG